MDTKMNEILVNNLTKTQQKIIKDVDKFIDYWQKAKGTYPPSIKLKRQDYDSINKTLVDGIKLLPPYTYLNIPIEPL